MDLFSRLLDERIIFLGEEIDDTLANIIVSQLLYLQSEDPKKDITMYINSPGGSVVSMWSMIDTMNLITCDVSTICVGMAASAASLMLANGAKGKRFILPHAEVMIHQPLGGARGQASDIAIQAQQILKTKELLHQFMADKTGQSIEKIARDMDRDYFMDAQEALAYGVVDAVIGDVKAAKTIKAVEDKKKK